MQAGLSTKNAPSIKVVVPHFIIGTLSFVFAALLMIYKSDDLLLYHLNGSVLAITHLMILGWATMIIFGALYQLIPVVMEVKLYSERMAYATLILFTSGLVLLITAFVNYQFTLTTIFSLGGGLIIFGVLLFAFNSLMSALKSKKGSISKLYIVSSCVYLVLVVVLGYFIPLNISNNYLAIAHTELMRIHLVMGLAGWFVLLIIGVASRLIPMFLIVHKTKENNLKIGYVLINAGILTYIIVGFGGIKSTIIDLLGLTFIILGILLFLNYNYNIYKKRLRKKLDIGMKLSTIGLIMFLLSILSFILLFFASGLINLPAGRLEIISGFILIYGFFTGLILGQTYKTLPFIIWLNKYQKLVGKQKTPLPADLYSDKLANIHMLSFYSSMLFVIAALIFSNSLMLKIGSGLILFTSVVYAYNVFKMIFHKTQIVK